jgi:hypothetical protein
MESLVAVRDRRSQVIARLSESYADDLFDIDELDRRLDLAHAARTVAELDALVADLGPIARPATTTALVKATDDPHRLATKTTRVLFSSVERDGRWSVPRELDLRVTFGNAVLDFREASLAAGVTTIDLRVRFGNLEVILPPGLAIDVDVSAVLGNVEERHRIPPDDDPTRPLVRFIGRVMFGNLELTTRLPGESAGDARKRTRRERKALRAAARKALPSGD